jgi:hypothetical protein
MDKTNYVLNKKLEPAANETVWAFDLGKGAIGDSPSPRWGEGGRRPDEVDKHFHHEFLHKASLLIPAEFAETKTAAGRRQMWRTRQAHKAREQWHSDGCDLFRGAHASGVRFSASRRKPRLANIAPPEIPEMMCAKSSGATPKLAHGTRALPKPEESRFYKGDPNNDIQTVSKEVLIGAIRKMNRCSHRPSPGGGGILVAASGKEAPCRSSAAVPGCGCGWRLAASSIAGRDARPTRRRDACATRFTQDYAAPTALGRIELKIPIKFSTRFRNGPILPKFTWAA